MASQSQSQPSLFFSVSDKRRQSISSAQRPRQAHRAKIICSFCKEEGHMVNDRQGNTVCPKLLNTECRYCHQKGHILSHCPMLKDKNSRRVAPEEQQEKKQETKSQSRRSPTARFSPAFLRIAATEMQSTNTPVPGNSPPRRPLNTNSRFAALVDDSDSDSESDSEEENEISLVNPAPPKQRLRGSWAMGRPSVSKISAKVIPVSNEQIPVKKALPLPPTPAKKKVTFCVQDDFADENEVPPTPPPTPSPTSTMTHVVDFNAFLGDVCDAWADEEEKESSETETAAAPTDGW